MEPTRVSRSELVGKTQNNTAVLEALVRANALNRTGDIDYNKYGKTGWCWIQESVRKVC